MTKKNKSAIVMLGLTMLAIGLVAGFFARPFIMPETAAVEDAAEDDAHGAHDHGDNVIEFPLDEIETLQLTTGKFEKRDYFKKVRIPAEFVEYLPDGRRDVAAPVSGQISEVLVAPGQAVKPKQPLFKLTVTDEQVSQAQVQLLSAISDIESRQAMLDRNRRLSDKNIVPRKKVIEDELALNNLLTKRKGLEQELILRGLSNKQLEQLLQNKNLITTFTILAPELKSISSDENQNVFTVETLHASQGHSLARGEVVCELVHHGKLLLKCQAYENDINKISSAQQNGWTFNAEVGEGDEMIVREGLPLHSIDNHVDGDSQTFSVYAAIENEVIATSYDAAQRPYVEWKFKSGQRAHLECPIAKWDEQVVVPADAVVHEGPMTYVFKRLDHTHATADGKEMQGFEKVPVTVLHLDRRFAVLESKLSLDLYEKYALNRAFQLNLALKQAAGGGGGHGHSHGPGGHSH